MCDHDRCSRFLLYFYVLGLWILFPFVYSLCHSLDELSTCISNKNGTNSSVCEERFAENYSWYQVTASVATIFTINIFSFTVICLYVIYRRYRIWKRGILHEQLYSTMA